MAAQSVGVCMGALLEQRSLGYSPRAFSTTLCGSAHLLSRFAAEAALDGHEGCVNTLQWSCDGSLLCSGSDEGAVCLWRFPECKLRLRFETGHQGNIFGAVFLPWRPAHDMVATCSLDATVRVHTIREGARGTLRGGDDGVVTEVVPGHRNRVKKLAVDAAFPHVVLSCSDDGTVGLIDLREGTRRVTPIAIPHGGRGVNSICVVPDTPLFAVGGNNPFVRLYDRRMLTRAGDGGGGSRHGPQNSTCVARFGPPTGLCHSTRACVTGVDVSTDGRRVAASYIGADVFVWALHPESALAKRAFDAKTGRFDRGTKGQHSDEAVLRYARNVKSSTAEILALSELIRRTRHRAEQTLAAACSRAGGRAGAGEGSVATVSCRTTAGSRDLGSSRQPGSWLAGISGSPRLALCGLYASRALAHHAAYSLCPGRSHHLEFMLGDSKVAELLCANSKCLQGEHQLAARAAAHWARAHVLDSLGDAKQAEELLQQLESEHVGASSSSPETTASNGGGLTVEQCMPTMELPVVRRFLAQVSGRVANGTGGGGGKEFCGSDNSSSSSSSSSSDSSSSDDIDHGGTRESEASARGVETHHRSGGAGRGRAAAAPVPNVGSSGGRPRRSGGGLGEAGSSSSDSSSSSGSSSSSSSSSDSSDSSGSSDVVGSGGGSGNGGYHTDESDSLSEGWTSMSDDLSDDGGPSCRFDHERDSPAIVHAHKPLVRFTGHQHELTVKEVNFFGPRSEFVMSGSDDGLLFIWDAETGRLVRRLQADLDVVNCAKGHPFDAVLATSGIERLVKIWSPLSHAPAAQGCKRGRHVRASMAAFGTHPTSSSSEMSSSDYSDFD
jgi:hypothetical protein